VFDWTEKEDVQREMRKEVKRLLRTRGFQEDLLEPLAREILNLARIHLKDY
jgi:type I restriction enzyme R subunit